MSEMRQQCNYRGCLSHCCYFNKPVLIPGTLHHFFSGSKNNSLTLAGRVKVRLLFCSWLWWSARICFVLLYASNNSSWRKKCTDQENADFFHRLDSQHYFKCIHSPSGANSTRTGNHHVWTRPNSSSLMTDHVSLDRLPKKIHKQGWCHGYGHCGHEHSTFRCTMATNGFGHSTLCTKHHLQKPQYFCISHHWVYFWN